MITTQDNKPKATVSIETLSSFTAQPLSTEQMVPPKQGESLTQDQRGLAEKLLLEPMDYTDSHDFQGDDAEKRIYDDAIAIPQADIAWYRPLIDDVIGTPAAKQSLKTPETTVLSAEQERVLFLQYNYARYQVAQLQLEYSGGKKLSDEQITTLLSWYHKAMGYREQIAETNLALVLAMAKRMRLNELDFSDLISEGNMALLRAVDKFDCDRGFKFSTYACRAILKAFSRQGMKMSTHRKRFPTEFDPDFEKSNHPEEIRRQDELESADEVKHIFLTNQAKLTETEQQVIQYRFGLNTPEKSGPQTLEQVGKIIGVTKERVRQIQNKAIGKMRLAFEDTNQRVPVSEMAVGHIPASKN